MLDVYIFSAVLGITVPTSSMKPAIGAVAGSGVGVGVGVGVGPGTKALSLLQPAIVIARNTSNANKPAEI
jgi:hypothetical protein